MTVTINGKREVLDGQRVAIADLLRLRGVAAPEMVSVQLNGRILDRGACAATLVHDGDVVELLLRISGG